VGRNEVFPGGVSDDSLETGATPGGRFRKKASGNLALFGRDVEVFDTPVEFLMQEIVCYLPKDKKQSHLSKQHNQEYWKDSQQEIRNDQSMPHAPCQPTHDWAKNRERNQDHQENDKNDANSTGKRDGSGCSADQTVYNRNEQQKQRDSLEPGQAWDRHGPVTIAQECPRTSRSCTNQVRLRIENLLLINDY
jgi:hypothetical protein